VHPRDQDSWLTSTGDRRPDPAQRQADLTSDPADRPVPLGCW
jgi:hypothetical protein